MDGVGGHVIAVSHHAAKRYAERRGGNLWYAEGELQKLFSRVATKRPPIQVSLKDGVRGRRFTVGEWVLITDPEITTIITCYPLRRTSQHKRKRKRNRKSA